MVTRRDVTDASRVLVKFYFLTTACTLWGNSSRYVRICALCAFLFTYNALVNFLKREAKESPGTMELFGGCTGQMPRDCQFTCSSSGDSRISYPRNMNSTCFKNIWNLKEERPAFQRKGEKEMEPYLHRLHESAKALKELSSLIEEKRVGLGRRLMTLAKTQGLWRMREELLSSLVFSQPVKWSLKDWKYYFFL